ncbi:MAG: hypothetical protein KKD17_03525 [Nanoarchaeota archaeon]|nr:hypothetical protein [Nanoarchaeota archaeon]
MPTRPKIDNPVVLYDVFRSYSGVPQHAEEQRALVGRIYNYVWAEAGTVATEDAKPSRVYHVAGNIVNKARGAYQNLTERERFLLDSLLRIHKSQKEQREARTERLCIQIEDWPDSDISARVERVAVQVLGHRLGIEGQPGSRTGI